jgi:3-oxoacyl-[acyl-carrier-protein] synthase-3
VEQRLHYVKQDGGTVFKFAVRMTEEISRRILERNQLPGERRRSLRLAPGQPAHHF